MDSLKKVFVTGITGLLGTNLVNQLLEEQYQVIGFLRNPARYIGNKTQNLTLIKGDLFDDFSRNLKEVDIVIHIAAQTDQDILEYEPYRKTNFEATQHLYKMAVENKVKKFIFISTANTSGFGDEDSLGFEDKPMQSPFTKSFYANSKKEAEDDLLFREDDIELKILCPTFMIGANDIKPSSGRIIQMGLNKKVIFYPPGGKNFVDVQDVVQAIINSFQYGDSHDKYLICNENLSYREFFQKLNKINQQKPIMIRIPRFLLMAVGGIGNLLRKFNVKTEICTTNMKSLCINNFYTNFKSITELKINYTPIEKAIAEASEYFKTEFPKIVEKRES